MRKRNICKNCTHYIAHGPLTPGFPIPPEGSCGSGKLLDGPPDDRKTATKDIAYGGGYDGYGDYIRVGEEFGCIHFVSKPSTK